MYEDCVWLPFGYMHAFMQDVFLGLGVPGEEAKICADVLIKADQLGIDSHGIGRLKPIYYDRVKMGIQKAVTNLEIVREGPTTAVLDGHDGMGQVVAYRAMEMAIQKAQKLGLGMVTARNSTHYGIAGYYCLMAVEAGMIGIAGTNARPSIAPTFGVENMLGTNPLSFGIPSDDPFPFLLDCATSVSQRGKIEVYDRENKELPEGWVIDRQGRTRTDTHQILEDLVSGEAALTPLGELARNTRLQGYGYATVVEILSAALQGGTFLKRFLASTRTEHGGPTTWGISLWPSILRLLSAWQNSRELPAKSCVHCGPHRRRPVNSAFTPPGKRNT
jgi:LDH2 family malate/lactate/ureidoglycolate dehydrogenase